MKNYKFDSESLFSFSESLPYSDIPSEYINLHQLLKSHSERLNFPSIQDDIGSFISLLVSMKRPKVIFEMGSGFGQSAFWYLLGATSGLEKIILTEKRDDLYEVFNELPWPDRYKSILEYHQDDAFEVLNKSEDRIDIVLIDGVKGDYLKFLELVTPKMNEGGLVLIDNSFWRGSFLSEEMREKKSSARNIYELHEYIKQTPGWRKLFVPYKDGLTILQKLL